VLSIAVRKRKFYFQGYDDEDRPHEPRIPAEIALRIGALARLPAFFALEDKRVRSSPAEAQAAAWKAELLSAAGARVEVFAPSFGEEMLALAAARRAARSRSMNGLWRGCRFRRRRNRRCRLRRRR
jgi:hypothetical protein